MQIRRILIWIAVGIPSLVGFGMKFPEAKEPDRVRRRVIYCRDLLLGPETKNPPGMYSVCAPTQNELRIFLNMVPLQVKVEIFELPVLEDFMGEE